MKKAAFAITIFLVAALFPAAALARDANAALSAVLKAYVEGRYHWRDVRISGLKLSQKPEAGSSGSSSGIRGLPTDIGIVKGPPGETVFDLGFAGGREIKATAEVTAYADVIKARRLLTEGSIIGPDDVYRAPEDVSGLEEGYFSDESALVGSQLTRSVGPGVTIEKEMVSSCPLVRRGRKVNIVVETPSFMITTVGRIQRDARVGSYAEVMNVSSKKLLWGLLADEDTVRIQAGERP
ncbi:MAG: flagellar basal body P-ring formation chaperone FlgA [Nitrospiraceae bacterium]|nr:flagellar basal body P-ring formation chaperone FlgA [Nitrospiraceae bacterium]